MDRLGYGTFWMAEHHFQPEGTECIPNVLMMALHLTHVTERLKHRLRLQHHADVAPAAPRRRLRDGGHPVGRTGRSSASGAAITRARWKPSARRCWIRPPNRELFEEQVDIIFKAFNEESFSHKGKHYTLPPEVPYRGYTLKELTLVPRPARLPVECWQPIQGGTQRALDFMAKHDICGVIGGGSAEGGAVHKSMVDFQAAYARVGKHIELGERMALGFQFYLADSVEKGLKVAAKYYEENMKMFGELRLVRALTDEQIEIMRDPKRAPTAKLPRIEDAVKAGGFLTGTPADVIESLKKLEERYPGLDRVTVSLSVGVPLSEALEQLEWFARDVMPAFKGVKVAAPVMAN